MIFIHDKIFAKVWKVEKSEKYIDLQVTTSEKDKEGNYVNSGWFPRLIGHAFNALKDAIKEGDTLIITKCKITNERYEDNEGNKKSRFKFVVLEASISESDLQIFLLPPGKAYSQDILLRRQLLFLRSPHAT